MPPGRPRFTPGHATAGHLQATLRKAGLYASILLCLLTNLAPARAADLSSLTLIRDTEIETTLRRWTAPVARQAGLDPDNVRIVLVRNPAVNAFVAGGPNIFLYTGLLLKAQNPDEVAGVLAHEMGHIAGGHLIRGREAMQNASYEAMIGTVLGIGAAVLSGQGAAGAAISAGSRSMAINRFLAHSRVQESSADQAALSFLTGANIPPAGLLHFLERLESEELLPADAQSEYVRTHPLTRNRVEALREGVRRAASSPKSQDSLSGPQDREAWARLKAKLTGFLTPEQVAWTYEDKDMSTAARYARAIADWRQNRVEMALSAMDSLLKSEPDNPYFLELKGQILLESGRVRQAIPFYRKAVERAPEAALIRIDLARAMIDGTENDPQALTQAIAHLDRAARTEDRSPLIRRLLATAWGRKGNEPMARLNLAEEALLQRRIPDAKRLAQQALDGLPPTARERIRALDILKAVEQISEKEK